MHTKSTISLALLFTLTTGCGLDIQLAETKSDDADLLDDTGFGEEDAEELDDGTDATESEEQELDEALEDEFDEGLEDEFEEDDGTETEDALDGEDAEAADESPEDADEEEEEVEEEILAELEFDAFIGLDLRTYDPADPTGDAVDTCTGSFTIHVSADGELTGEATCRQVTYANYVSLELDASVVGSDIVGDATITYNGRDFDFPIDGSFSEDALYIGIDTSWQPTSRLTQEFVGGIDGTL